MVWSVQRPIEQWFQVWLSKDPQAERLVIIPGSPSELRWGKNPQLHSRTQAYQKKQKNKENISSLKK